MKTTLITFDEIEIIVPFLNDSPLEIPYKCYTDLPSYCGAGQGLGDKIVPEYILGLKVSLACLVHDVMWELAEPSWQDFHASNSAFLHNILSIIRTKSDNLIIEHLRNYRAVTYYNAVDTIGTSIFWNIKKEQGHAIHRTVRSSFQYDHGHREGQRVDEYSN